MFFCESAGIIVGLPPQAANATLTLAVTDASGASASATLNLDVLATNLGTAYYVDNIAGSDTICCYANHGEHCGPEQHHRRKHSPSGENRTGVITSSLAFDDNHCCNPSPALRFGVARI